MKLSNNHPLLSKLLATLLACIVLAGYILLTDPDKIPLPLLMVPFVLVGIILYEMTSLLVLVFTQESDGTFVRLLPISIGFVGVMLMVLSSLHQLTWKDTLLLVLFTALFWLYIWRADFLRKKS